MGLVTTAIARYLLTHRWHLVLTLLGIAAGVAVVVSVDLANDSARRAFQLSSDALDGETTHRIVGSASGFDESVYTTIRRDGWRDSAPSIEGFVRIGDETLRLLGIDPFADTAVRGETVGLDGDLLRSLLSGPDAVVLPETSANRLNIAVGDRPLLDFSLARKPVTVVGLLPDPLHQLDGLVIADISTAQELLNRIGTLDRVDLILTESRSADALQRLLPEGLLVENAETSRNAKDQMTRAFSTNLQAMSLLALIVAMYLIYNTMIFSVLRRRRMLALLRALGVQRSQLTQRVLIEAAVLGVIGTTIGIGLGIALAHFLLGLVTRSINDLYFVLHTTELAITPWPLLKSAVLGVGASLTAALLPALEAARTHPQTAQQRSTIESRSTHLQPWILGGALVFAVAAGAILPFGTSLYSAFTALFFLIIAFSAMAGPLVRYGSRFILAILAKFGSGGLVPLAVRGLETNLSRVAPAVAALAVALSSSIGVTIMIDSFRQSVADWIGQTLQADIYVTTAQRTSEKFRGELPRPLLERLAGLDGVRSVSTGLSLRLTTRQGAVEALILDPAQTSRAGFRFLTGNSSDIWNGFVANEGVLISEPLSYHRQLKTGAAVDINTDSGYRTFPIAGVFRDYGSDQGLMVIHRSTFDRHFLSRAFSTVGLYLDAGANPEAVRAETLSAIADLGNFSVRTTGDITAASLAVFDRTFTITGVLQVLTLGVAFIGILGALLALLLERGKDFAVLRACGGTPLQVRGVVSLQTLAIGIMSLLLSIPLGVVLSVVLVDVINRRSFGWSMDIVIMPNVVVMTLGVALLSAAAAALYPAWRIGRDPPAAWLREE